MKKVITGLCVVALVGIFGGCKSSQPNPQERENALRILPAVVKKYNEDLPQTYENSRLEHVKIVNRDTLLYTYTLTKVKKEDLDLPRFRRAREKYLKKKINSSKTRPLTKHGVKFHYRYLDKNEKEIMTVKME